MWSSVASERFGGSAIPSSFSGGINRLKWKMSKQKHFSAVV